MDSETIRLWDCKSYRRSIRDGTRKWSTGGNWWPVSTRHSRAEQQKWKLAVGIFLPGKHSLVNNWSSIANIWIGRFCIIRTKASRHAQITQQNINGHRNWILTKPIFKYSIFFGIEILYQLIKADKTNISTPSYTYTYKSIWNWGIFESWRTKDVIRYAVRGSARFRGQRVKWFNSLWNNQRRWLR